MFSIAAAALCLVGVNSKQAFVFEGATGDNALRDGGVWQGLYEAFAGGVFEEAGGVTLFVAANKPHTDAQVRQKALDTLQPLYKELQTNAGWACKAAGSDCRPEAMLSQVIVNVWSGRDACAQAANMSSDLEGYDRVSLYLSIPPFAFGEWARCAVQNWDQGKHRVHVACEKPFGTGLQEAKHLREQLADAGVPEGNIHLVDHWLSFFMNKHLPNFRNVVVPKLGLSWDSNGIECIVITEYEARGLEGRGGFFDGVGQVRDMVQSHLLQVLAVTLGSFQVESSLPQAKLEILNAISVKSCRLGQYEGFLLEPQLGFHAGFADSTFCNVALAVNNAAWNGVPVNIATGKLMGELRYSVEVFQKGGPGVLTFEIGREETGLGGIRVDRWPLKDSSPFTAPAGGFDESASITVSPAVDSEGNGYIIKYDSLNMYFPRPYSAMAASLLKGDYHAGFVTWPECQRSWEIVTMSNTSDCLDPAPERVGVYAAPSNNSKCKHEPLSKACWLSTTVKDLYEVTYACNAANDKKFMNVSFYRKKCNPSPKPSRAHAAPAIVV